MSRRTVTEGDRITAVVAIPTDLSPGDYIQRGWAGTVTIVFPGAMFDNDRDLTVKWDCGLTTAAASTQVRIAR